MTMMLFPGKYYKRGRSINSSLTEDVFYFVNVVLQVGDCLSGLLEGLLNRVQLVDRICQGLLQPFGGTVSPFSRSIIFSLVVGGGTPTTTLFVVGY